MSRFFVDDGRGESRATPEAVIGMVGNNLVWRDVNDKVDVKASYGLQVISIEFDLPLLQPRSKFLVDPHPSGIINGNIKCFSDMPEIFFVIFSREYISDDQEPIRFLQIGITCIF